MRAAGLITLFVYVLGIPITYYALLWSKQDMLYFEVSKHVEGAFYSE